MIINKNKDGKIGPNGETWEQEGRIEKRYQWNGAFLDLCDLPPSEYMKTIFVTKNEGGGGGGYEPTENKVRVVETSDAGIVRFQAFSEKNADNDIVISITVRTQTGIIEDKLTIKKGKSESNIKEYKYGDTDLKPRVESVSAPGLTEPVEIPEILPSLYTLSDFDSNISKLTPDMLIKASRKTTVDMKTQTESFKFNSSLKPVKNTTSESADAKEIEKFLSDNATDIYIVTDREVVDICAAEKFFSDIVNWERLDDMRDESAGITYHVWRRRDLTGPQTFIEGDAEDKNWEIIVLYK